MRHSVILLGMALSLSACGEVKQAAEDEFKKEFVSTFTQECVKGVDASGIPTNILTKSCECTATELVETQGMTELMNLDLEKAMPIYEECAAEAELELYEAASAGPLQRAE